MGFGCTIIHADSVKINTTIITINNGIF